MKSALTVIIPVFNGEQYLETQIESIVKQLDSNDRIICLNDASTDNSVALLDVLIKKYPMLSYSSNATNIGPNRTVWNLLHKVGTNLFVFCDQDDIWLPNRLDIVRRCKKGELSIVGYQPFNMNGRRLNPVLPTHFSCGLIMSFIKPSIPGCTIGGCVDTVRLLFPDSGIKTLYDQFIMVHLNLKKITLKYDQEVRVLYRRHQGTVTSLGFAPNGIAKAIKRRFDLLEDFFGAIFK